MVENVEMADRTDNLLPSDGCRDSPQEKEKAVSIDYLQTAMDNRADKIILSS